MARLDLGKTLHPKVKAWGDGQGLGAPCPSQKSRGRGWGGTGEATSRGPQQIPVWGPAPAPTDGPLCPKTWAAGNEALGRWPHARGHGPHHNLPFVSGADASKGRSCVSYTHWEDVGFSWLRNAAARSSAGWASDSAAGDGAGAVQTGSRLLVRQQPAPRRL